MVKPNKYPQEVSAEMQRFRDSNGKFYLDRNGKCYMTRNKTKIKLGDSDKLIGSIIMTNPGSYGLNKIDGWNGFVEGKGSEEKIEGIGSPDLTMQNILGVIEETFNKANKPLPDGYLDVFNISSVVCPKGGKAVEYHSKMGSIIRSQGLSREILTNPIVINENEFNNICARSQFVIIGFVKGIFETYVGDIVNWSKKYPDKIIYSLDDSGWYSHPRRWRTEKYLHKQASDILLDIILGE